METRIESQMQKWKEYGSRDQRYLLGRSCTYESAPTEGNSYPRLTIRIFIHKILGEEERKVGEISIFVERDRWNILADLNNAVKANTQLIEAANSAKEGNWNTNPLPELLRKACQEIPREIARYESADQLISGSFSI